MIPGNLLLPDPEILKKLKAIDPSAPDLIMDMAKSIAANRRRQEKDGAMKALLNCSLRERLARIFSSNAYHLPVANAGEAISQNFATVGDDLRQAILTYMQNNGLNAKTAGLTDYECRSLNYVSVSCHGHTHPPAAPRPASE